MSPRQRNFNFRNQKSLTILVFDLHIKVLSRHLTFFFFFIVHVIEPGIPYIQTVYRNHTQYKQLTLWFTNSNRFMRFKSNLTQKKF